MLTIDVLPFAAGQDGPLRIEVLASESLSARPQPSDSFAYDPRPRREPLRDTRSSARVSLSVILVSLPSNPT